MPELYEWGERAVRRGLDWTSVEADYDDQFDLGGEKSGYFIWLKAFMLFLHTRDLAFYPSFLPPFDD